ncbi:MAG: diacylglycerol kinase family protein [Acutalibacteraceae bacterium]|nr:diacylglycerol kinase family protein [Acutalibacteraceae bacterium]
MRYVFIINPAAGKGKVVKQLCEEIAEYCSLHKLEYAVQITTARGDAQRFANEHAKKGDDVTIFLAGGEGTVFEALNGVFGYDNVCLAVIPIGSANDFLKFFPKDLKSAFRSINEQINGKPIKMDIIRAGDKYCLNGCSVGMDAVVAKYMNDFRRIPFVSGSMAYNLAIVKCFLGKIGCRLFLKADESDLGSKKCLFAVVANGPAYGGGYLAAPDAVPFDGILNYTIVENISKLKILRFIGRYKKGEIDGLPFVHREKCSTFAISSTENVPVNLDGEIFEMKEVDFEIIKSGVNFLLPNSVCKLLFKN